MLTNRKLAIMLLVAASVLGAIAARGDAVRRATQQTARATGIAAQQAKARLESEENVLRQHLGEAAATKPLLAALQNQVDGPTLRGLFQSQDWWRNVRAEFQISRVVVGAEVLATLGSPSPGSRDRDVVVQARRLGIASAVVTIEGRPYALLASRLPVLPEKAPVLVLAKLIDPLGSMSTASAPETGSRSAVDFALWAAVLLTALGAIKLLVSRKVGGGASAGKRDTSDVGGLESTLKFGATVRTKAPTDVSPSTGARDAATSSVSIRVKAPPPSEIPSTGAPVAHPRHATAPDGTPVASDGKPGQRFGRYKLLNRIGEGGMSEVFTAMADGVEGFRRVFVLKRLRPELSRDKEAVGQFIDEARMQASLVHSNIVPVFDFGRVGNEYFMTQEYIVGRDVTRVMASYYEHCQQTLDPRLAYYIALETLQALQYAHARRDKDGQPLGIVHRDVSAGNIILSAQGEVKLADFGIVKSNKRVTKTQVGMVKGNANFMSPEQARGHEVDARSDLFSIALVLYYCLTNRLLYDGDNDLDVLFKAASGPTAEIQDQISQLPSPARDVLGRALAFDPAERFQTAAEFAEVLAPHIGGAKAEAAHLMQTLFGDELQREAA